ncbi:hypothetical protein SEA_QUAMMI_88 [Microbacterium phage Quammi]|nr:hypothetical protein SEA_CASEND_90 [Microbacterium phage Casend]QWY80574.1 hypothetical protein SEA_QUAMMI_88 [Microbacterium phage Quammi]UVG33932.1 hypothetical protein SEA_VICEROY_87 [Microbacterium phage Viceroy]
MAGERHAGFYTVSMVKAGHVDQWAVDRSYGRVVVELKFDRVRNLFVVTETVTDQVGTARRESTHHYLSDAHHAFTTLTRKHQ